MDDAIKAFDWVIRAGASGVLLLGYLALKNGWLATRQEVLAVIREIAAWQGRAERAEKQVDVLLQRERDEQ